MASLFKSICYWVALCIVCAPAATAAAQCGGDAKEHGPGELGWVKSDGRIFAASENGKFVQLTFNPPQVKILGDHNFKYMSSIKVSTGKRFILYQGYIDKTGEFESYLYDTKLQQVRAIPLLSSVNFESFSPDGTRLAWLSERNVSRPGLSIMNVATFEIDTFSYPVPLVSREARYVALEWGSKGKHIYVTFMNEGPSTYFEFDLTSKTFSEISGVYAFNSHHYLKWRVWPASTFSPDCPQSRCYRTELPAGSARVNVWIDENKLLVQSPGEKSLEIVRSKPDPCGVPTLRLAGWLDSGQYLVYVHNGVPYVYGVRERRASSLGALKYFFW